ncbi:Bud13 [Macleaya cordata]|uniref:Bud13 n=1 Tax=Macleaya cordata TaxID=56857 RepID=A0A200QLF9_MACCD|nr:Bud13 [Macleaya cordata]
MAASTSLSLKEYLKRYENNDDGEKKTKKKKSKKIKKDPMGVLVVDEDPVWQKPVIIAEEEEDSEDEEKPQVDEDIELKRMKRLEHIRSQRPYNAISDDGSGWISISDAPKHLSSSKSRSPDVSPSREGRNRYDTPSPEVELKPMSSGDKDPDLSPPRQKRRRFHTPSPEPEQESKPSNSINPDHDLSPPRRSHSQTLSRFKKKNEERLDSPDLSPPRRVRPRSPEVDATLDSRVADLSPPRKSRKGYWQPESLDLSPARRIRHKSVDAPGDSLVSDLSPPRKNKKGGLLLAQEMKKEIEKKKKEEFSRFKEMDPSVSGRDAERIYRDKEGKRISKDEALKLQKGEEKPKEKKLVWGKGLVQKREAEAREHELEVEKDKPFARTRDDPELDNMLKERVRWGDPMAHLMKRKQPEMALGNLGDDEKMKESGFMIPQDIPSHSWIKRRIDAPPNRYGIRPGRHWDGVDRSNGYEKEFFKRTNEKQATEREAYLWSVSDM